jgi:hypothetical protein
MAKKSNLADALQNASGKTQIRQPANEIKPSPVKELIQGTPPSRQGKKAVTGFFDPVVSRQLKQLALDEDKTVQLLITEALNDLFVKYNHKPIA